jgi:hypothetical protein
LAKWKQEREASRKSDRKLKRKILVVDDDWAWLIEYLHSLYSQRSSLY